MSRSPTAAIEKLGLATKARTSAPASSPAPAMPAASSRPPTPSVTRRTSATGARPRRARYAAQHPSDRLPPFLRAALHQRHRTDRRQGAGRGAKTTQVEGYHLFTGGGFGPDAEIGQEVFRDLKAEDTPQTVETLLKAYLAQPCLTDETFLDLCPSPRRSKPCASWPTRKSQHEPDHAPPGSRSFRPNAPFSDRQRLWLNGFFVGMLGLDGTTPLSPDQDGAICWGRPATATTAKRPGTTRRCRSPIA